MKTLFLFFSFSLNCFLYPMSKPNAPSYDSVMNVINNYSSEIKKEKGIDLTWYGLDYAGTDKIYDGKIHLISLGYRVDKAMKFDEAKDYYYELVDEFLNRINKNEKNKNYFYHYPVGYEDLHFCLSFDYENKGYLKHDEVNSIHIGSNKIFYEIVDVEGPSQPILEARAPDLFLMKGYTKEPRCIIRKLPEFLDLTDGNASKNTTETTQGDKRTEKNNQ